MKSETITENIFRDFYGAKTFIEKSAIPKEYGFKSKRGTNMKGFPDFYYKRSVNPIIVEAKADNIEKAKEEVQFYLLNNKIKTSLIGIAISGQKVKDLEVVYYYKEINSNKCIEFGIKNQLLKINKIDEELKKALKGDDISNKELIKILNSINNSFHKMHIRDTERSLLFSAFMIALNNDNFRKTYNDIQEFDNKKNPNFNKCHYMNTTLLNAIEIELKEKINNLSKEFNWKDRFSFIKTINIDIYKYKKLINDIEKSIYIPFKNNEKLDILGKAYKIFLKRAGKVDNKNIIITPDHIKDLMVKLARINKNDVVLDTCTGSGGFLMDAMETMLKMANGNEKKEKEIKAKQLIGFEIDYVLFSLACSNMFLHGDGKTNMIYRSSLLTDDEEDQKVYKYIKKMKPTKVIINPPYENNAPILFVESAINYLEENGLLIIIMPSITIEKNKEKFESILKVAKLDFIIKMPENLFNEQDRHVDTSIFGFTKTPQRENDKVIFTEIEDDGLVSVQHCGRLDIKHKWQPIENEILDIVLNKQEIKNKSFLRKIIDKKGKINLVFENKNKDKNMVSFDTLFNTSLKGTLQSTKCDESGKYDFITGSKEWKKHTSYDKDMEAIVFCTQSGGSLGRSHYVNGKFTASSLMIVLTPKDAINYPLDLEFYSYYLMAIRKKLVEDLKSGSSKPTIKIPKLNKYLIQYFDYNEQLKRKKIYKEQEKELIKEQEKVKLLENNLYNEILKK